jgi:hypothetical protein
MNFRVIWYCWFVWHALWLSTAGCGCQHQSLIYLFLIEKLQGLYRIRSTGSKLSLPVDANKA